MPRDRQYHVYIMASRSKTLYVGVTSDLGRRMQQHKEKQVAGFTARYSIDRLVYVEATSDVNAAIAREKEIKGWARGKKVALIESVNLGWADLAESWLVVGDES
jgi:putative endonuclease